VIGPQRDDLADLQTFLVQLGAALNEAGEAVHSVQERLTRAAHAYGADAARISAFPTYMMVTMGRGEPATLELTTSLVVSPRLDQIAALDRLVHEAENGAVAPAEGLRRLDGIRDLSARFGPVQRIIGYSVLSLGICLILHPSPRDVAAAAVFGAIVGVLRSVGRYQPALQILMPVIAAFTVSALSAVAVKHEWADPGLRAMVASLVIFLPGAALTTSVLELAAGQMVSGSARLVSGAMQLALLAFGILAGIEAVGVPSASVLSGSHEVLGDWAPWLGVVIFAAGVTVAYCAPVRAFPALLVVLYSAWIGQVVGNAIFGVYVSAFVGALVMTPVAYWVARLPSAMPQYASFLPGFWLLVPGALGLIGLTELAGDANAAGSHDLVATAISIFAVALGVLCGTLILAGATATGRLVDVVSGTRVDASRWLKRGPRRRSRGRRSSSSGDPPTV
jgi:uncharacterized membrane protein YjjP (DUF1212 family)